MAISTYRPFLAAFVLFNVALPTVAQGTQFITGACTKDADCASSCCGFKSGKCAGPIVAQERDGGCGFGDAQPNDIAAVALGFTGPAPTTFATVAVAATSTAPSATVLAAGTQFITGACSKDADCASSCCGFNSGKCAGPIVAQERDGGCGFGDAQPNDAAAVALGFTGQIGGGKSSAVVAAAVPADTGASTTVETAGTQFITGVCTSDADCASRCCGFNSGKCAGPIVAQERDGGCGFGDAQPNDIAAVALGFTGQVAGGSPPAAVPASATAAGTTTATTAPGTQFITGACTSDADCASSCCGFNSGKCAGPVVAQERDGGCGFGDAQPNDIAAQKLRGQR